MISVLRRSLAPLALCFWSQSAAADCAMLHRIQDLSPLVDAVLTEHGGPALFDLETAVRRLDPATVQSAFRRSGHSELIVPVSQYLSVVGSLIQAPDSSSTWPSIAAGRAFIDDVLADACAEEPAPTSEARATTGKSTVTGPAKATTAASNATRFRSPISPRVLLVSFAGIATALALAVAVAVWRQRKRTHTPRTKRLPCRYATRLLVDGREFPCVAIDFSATGCKLTVPSNLPKARDVKILLDGRALDARIAWRTEFFAGIRVSPGVPAILLEKREAAIGTAKDAAA